MRTVLLPPGDNPIAVNKYIIYIFFSSIALISSRTGNDSRFVWILSSLFEGQDRQCTCKVTWRRVRATTAAVENQLLLHIVSV